MPTPIFAGSRMVGRSTGLLIRSSGAPSVPTDISLSDSSVDEISGAVAAGTTIGTFSTTGGVAPFSYAITGGAGAAQFTIDGTELKAAVANTLSAGSSPYSIDVQVTDGNSATLSETFSISVVGTVLIETVTVDNFSGASRDNPTITIARDFIEGAVPTGTKVDIRYSSSSLSLQQADQRAYHDDGSLKRAVFAFKPTATYADAGNLAFDFYKTSGSFSNSTSISISTLTAQNFQMRIKVGGTNYYCVLNNLISAGTYRTVAQGTAKLGIEAYGIFRAGTGASDTDQGQFQGLFWADIRSDGSIEVMAAAINGRVASGSAVTVDEAELLNGATSLRLYTTDFTWYAHNALWFCDDNCLPYCTSGVENFWPRSSWAYVDERKISPHVLTNGTRNAAISVPTPENYAPNMDGDIGTTDINGGGGNNWIGHVPIWSAKLLSVNADTGVSAANRKAFLKSDRINALAGQVKFNAWFVRPESGLPPVLVNQDYTSAGLTSAQPTVGWQSAATISDSGGTYTGAQPDPSHTPNYGYVQWAITGRPWWAWMQLVHVVGLLGSANPGTGVEYSRRPTINGTTFDCSGWQQVQMRQLGWQLRGISQMAWTLADDHPCKAYMAQLLTNSWAVGAEMMTAPFSSTAKIAVGAMSLPYLIDPDGKGSDVGWSNFQGSYLAVEMAMWVWRGQLSSSHILITSFLEKGLLGPHKACFFWSAGVYAFSYRSGSQGDNTDAIIQADYSDAYIDVGATGQYTGMTTKLISDSGGSSGACPASGTHTAFQVGHSYPQLIRGAIDLCDRVGIGGALTALLAKANAEDAAASLTDSAWAGDQLQWDIRRP